MNQGEGKQESQSFDFVHVLCLEEEITDLEQNIMAAKGRLESLQNELALMEQKKSETKVQIKNILENAEKKNQEFHEELITLTEQKNSIEEQYKDLFVRCGKSSDELNGISQTLQDKNEELKRVMDELAAAKHEKKFISKKRRFMSRAVLAALIIVMFCGWTYYKEEVSAWEGLYQNARDEKNDSLEKLSQLEEVYQDIKTEKDEALVKLSEIKGLYENTKTERDRAAARLSQLEEHAGPAMIKVNKVYNGNNSKKEIKGGLKESEMRYLCFDFDVYFLDDNVKEATIYLDIYKPDGSLHSSVNSPLGHTTSYKVDQPGHVNSGWGNNSESTYPAGTYRIDFVYKGGILRSQKVVISK